MSFFKPKNSSNASSVNTGENKPFIGVQAKLNIGKSNDKYEQEADTVADKVINKKGLFGNEPFFAPIPNLQQSDKSSLQRTQETSKEGKESEMIQEKPLHESITPLVQTKGLMGGGSDQNEEIQRSPDEEENVQKSEEEEIQQKEDSGGGDASQLESQLSSSKGGGNPMDTDTKNQMESGFGADFSNVRIHNDSNAIQMNKNLGAKAFANGNDIYFNEGQYNPSSKEGQHLLAHELTHTIQQGGGKSSAQTKPDIQLSPLSDELTALWNDQGKGAFYNRLRQVAPLSDPDLIPFVLSLSGDDLWLTRNIITYGPESGWPIHLKVEREMKGWGDSGGKGVVFDMLRSANGAEYGNMELHLSLNRVFAAGSEDIWLANNLLQHGIEANWPIHLKIEREMKGWADSGGVTEVHNILRIANGAESGNALVSAAIIRELATATKYERWLALQLWEHGIEANFPVHVGIMNFFYEKGDETTINIIITNGLTIQTFTGAFDTWQYDDGRIVEVDISSRLGGNTTGTTIRLNANKSIESSAMTLYHELAHVTSAEPDYLEQEIQVRIQTEQYAIDHGLPPTGTNYRKADGTVNEAVIRAGIMGSNHYNPTGRRRINRRYEGDVVIGPWALPL